MLINEIEERKRRRSRRKMRMRNMSKSISFLFTLNKNVEVKFDEVNSLMRREIRTNEKIRSSQLLRAALSMQCSCSVFLCTEIKFMQEIK